MQAFVLALLPVLPLAPTPHSQGTEAVAPSLGQGFGLESEGNRATAAGPDYKARFEPGLVVFTPALGSRAPRNLPLAWRLVGAERGSILPADPAAAPSVESSLVVYRHGDALVERYAIRSEGIEQSFVLHSLPAGPGELKMRMALETELEGRTLDDGREGARFQWEGLGGVSVGAVTGIDAEGRTVRGRVRVEGSELVLALPADFVDRAALPLVVDPLVGVFFDVADSATLDDTDPDVAYDVDTDSYFAVWQRVFSFDDSDIRGRRFQADGTLLGNVLLIENDDDVQSWPPKVANVNAADRYVVAWHQANPDDGASEIAGRTVTTVPGGGALGPIRLLAEGGEGHRYPDLGGDRGESRREAVMVWRKDGYGILSRKLGVEADGSLTLYQASEVVVDTAGVAWTKPAISKCSGDVGRYLVAFKDILGQGVSARALSNEAIPLGTQLDDLVPVADIVQPFFPEVDGDGTLFLVVWSQNTLASSDHAIYGRAVAFAGGDLVALDTGVIHDTPDFDEWEAVVAYVGDHFVVGWIDAEDGFLVGSHSPRAVPVDALTLQTCGPVTATALLVDDSYGLTIVSRYSGGQTQPLLPILLGDTPPDAALVWTRDAPLQGDIQAQIFETRTDVDAVASGCGAGSAYAPCAFEGNPDFALPAARRPPLRPQPSWPSPSAATP